MNVIIIFLCILLAALVGSGIYSAGVDRGKEAILDVLNELDIIIEEEEARHE